MPEYFLIYGFTSLIISWFVWRSKQMEVLYAWSIDILIGTGFLLFSKVFFAIAIELGQKT